MSKKTKPVCMLCGKPSPKSICDDVGMYGGWWVIPLQ